MPEEVTDGVIQHRLAHAKVVYLEDERLLVDTGPESEWDDLRTFIESTDGVERVLISHAHGDHVGNVRQVIDTYGPEILYPANEPLEETPLEEDDVTTVADGQDIGDDVRVLEMQGHTRGICALHLPERRTLLATDVLDGSDRRGLPPGYLLPPPEIYNWDSGLAESNLSRLLDLEFDRAVVTHGSNVDSDPQLKIEKFLNFADHYRKDLLES